MKDNSQMERFLTIQNVFFFVLLIGATVAFLWLINDFIMPIFWAIVLAIVFNPARDRLVLISRSKALGSLCTIIVIFCIMFVPLWFVGGLVVDESISFYNRISITDFSTSQTNLIHQIFSKIELLGKYGVEEKEISAKLTSFGQTASKWFAEQMVAFGQATFSLVVSFFLMTYILFFLLLDGKDIGTRILHILPLGDTREKALYGNFVRITRSIFKGTIVIALIQGAIGGILFFIAGINGALLFAVVMAFLSIIPAVGPALIWLPAGIILLLGGFLWQGALILLGGGIIISLIDNILRPLLVRRDVSMPDMVILVSTLGGIALFGITGFIIGPIIAGFFFSLWSIFEADYQKELEYKG